MFSEEKHKRAPFEDEVVVVEVVVGSDLPAEGHGSSIAAQQHRVALTWWVGGQG